MRVLTEHKYMGQSGGIEAMRKENTRITEEIQLVDQEMVSTWCGCVGNGFLKDQNLQRKLHMINDNWVVQSQKMCHFGDMIICAKNEMVEVKYLS